MFANMFKRRLLRIIEMLETIVKINQGKLCVQVTLSSCIAVLISVYINFRFDHKFLVRAKFFLKNKNK